jgi:hypothetical protein
MKASELGIEIGDFVRYPSPIGLIWAEVIEFAGAQTAVIVKVWEVQHIIDVRYLTDVKKKGN